MDSTGETAKAGPRVTIEVARKAIMGAHIASNGELYASYGGIPQECQDALRIVFHNQEQFRELVCDRLSALPLMEKYFGSHIRARLAQTGFLASPILSAVFDDEHRLERRLQNVQGTLAFDVIFQEIGEITDPAELDRRLLDAWAEIRVIDQLIRDGFVHLRKVETPADLLGRYGSQEYAVQVTRISREPEFPDLPTGDLQQIYDSAEESIGAYFWPSIGDKNLQLKAACSDEYVRRIAVVTSTHRLQDSLNRHIACRQIRDSILALEARYFEELQWLPDVGNGFIFRCEESDAGPVVRCLADWQDSAASLGSHHRTSRRWRDIDLDSDVPAYLDDEARDP